MKKFKVYEDKDYDPSVNRPVMVIYCLNCGHSMCEHEPQGIVCSRQWTTEYNVEPRQIFSCDCTKWDPSEPTPLVGKNFIEEGYVWAPYVPILTPKDKK